MWEPVDSIGNANGVGGGDPDVVAAVVVEARANVVAASGMDCKGFTAFCAFVGVYFDSGWC